MQVAELAARGLDDADFVGPGVVTVVVVASAGNFEVACTSRIMQARCGGNVRVPSPVL